MKEQYIAEIVQYVNEQDEKHIRLLAEATHFVDTGRLTYILTFVSKLFGGH